MRRFAAFALAALLAVSPTLAQQQGGGGGSVPNPFAPGQQANTDATGDATADVSTNAFVAAAIAPLNPASSVLEATTTALPNTPTYNNGTAGVGATLTSATNTALSIDSVATVINGRYLVKNQASTFQNGIYTLTQVGTGSVPWILTRATDYNTPSNINYTGTVPVIAGTTNANTNWLLTSNVTTIGTSAITYASQSTPTKGSVVSQTALTAYEVVMGAGGQNVITPSGVGTAGQALTSNGAGAFPTFQACPQTATSATASGCLGAPQNAQTASYQLVAGDAAGLVNMGCTGACTLTIPANASVAFPTGTVIDVVNTGTASDTIAITTDTLEIGFGGSLISGSVIVPVGGTYSLLKIGTTTWLASGNQGAPTRVFVGSYTVSGSSTSSVASSSLTGGVGIPAGYNNLIIRISGRTLNTADSTGAGSILLQLNGDTTTGHYTGRYNIFVTGNSFNSGTETPTANGVGIGNIPNSNGGATAFGSAHIEIFNYNQPTNTISIQGITNANGRQYYNSAIYTPSAVISAFQITAYNDAANATADFAAGTLIEVYAEQ